MSRSAPHPLKAPQLFSFQIGNQRSDVHLAHSEDALLSIYADLPAHLTVIDRSVANAWPSLVEHINNLKTPGAVLTIQSGDRSKEWPTVAAILDAAVAADLDRRSAIVIIGGGATCDTATFAAAIYMRGIRVRLVPSTLLCMVDAALGGKCGINWQRYKNLVGVFHPAEQILVMPDLLATLPDAEYRNGLAEVIKSAMLGDMELFGLLRLRHEAVCAREPAVIQAMVEGSLRIKGAIVEEDYREQGRRAHLNLGHTFAHALESVGNLSRWSHGEAVAWGIAQAMWLGEAVHITDSAYRATAIETLERYGFATAIHGLDIDQLVQAMKGDKKRHGNEVRFVLQRRLGETLVAAQPLSLVRACLARHNRADSVGA